MFFLIRYNRFVMLTFNEKSRGTVGKNRVPEIFNILACTARRTAFSFKVKKLEL
jgi:hypothetical protein